MSFQSSKRERIHFHCKAGWCVKDLGKEFRSHGCPSKSRFIRRAPGPGVARVGPGAEGAKGQQCDVFEGRGVGDALLRGEGICSLITKETNVAMKRTPVQSCNLCVLVSTGSSQSSGM